jgi:REP element-mobilizing transposase RayT
VADHIHLLIGIPPTIAVADMIRLIKANSSKWMNERMELQNKFQWQTGYGAFTVSHSQKGALRRYIRNQEGVSPRNQSHRDPEAPAGATLKETIRPE